MTPKLLYTKTEHKTSVIPNIHESIFVSLNIEWSPSVSNINTA